jgi:hypothetical protein
VNNGLNSPPCLVAGAASQACSAVQAAAAKRTTRSGELEGAPCIAVTMHERAGEEAGRDAAIWFSSGGERRNDG